MKKRQLWSSLLLFPVLSTGTFLTTASSCSKNNQEINTEISCNNMNQTVTKNSVSFNILWQIPVSSSRIDVEIINDKSKKINLTQSFIELQGDTFVLNCEIDSTVVETSFFDFDIKFYFYDAAGRDRIEYLYGFQVRYFHDTPEHQDTVLIDKRVDEITNTHIFSYTVQIFHKPQSFAKVKLYIANEATGMMSLPINAFVPEETDHGYFIKFDINLDISVYKSNNFYFDLVVDFYNFWGHHQTTTLKNIVGVFVHEDLPEIPDDYFDITIDGERKILTGLKSGINRAESGIYQVLRIPDGVTEISGNAFGPDWGDYLSAIQNIYIPSTVVQIGLHAFVACVNALEIDITEYTRCPAWLVFPVHQIFAGKQSHGFIWTNNDLINNAINDGSTQSEFGICSDSKQPWQVYSMEKILPTNFYQFNAQTGEIMQINPQRSGDLWKYKIIKIPQYIKTQQYGKTRITSIAGDALSILKTYPYLKGGNPYCAETRLLVLHPYLKTLSQDTFKKIGVGGSIFLNCNSIHEIPDYCFAKCDDYGDPKLSCPTIDVPSVSFITNLPNVNKIGKFAFCGLSGGVTNDWGGGTHILKIPQNVNSIGACAFFDCHITELTIPAANDIGKFAFASNYDPDASDDRLWDIDLSSYKFIPNWFMDDKNFTFIGSCWATKPEGKRTPKVHFSAELKKLLEKEGSDPKQWSDDWKKRHYVPAFYEVKWGE